MVVENSDTGTSCNCLENNYKEEIKSPTTQSSQERVVALIKWFEVPPTDLEERAGLKIAEDLMSVSHDGSLGSWSFAHIIQEAMSKIVLIFYSRPNSQILSSTWFHSIRQISGSVFFSVFKEKNLTLSTIHRYRYEDTKILLLALFDQDCSLLAI